MSWTEVFVSGGLICLALCCSRAEPRWMERPGGWLPLTGRWRRRFVPVCLGAASLFPLVVIRLTVAPGVYVWAGHPVYSSCGLPPGIPYEQGYSHDCWQSMGLRRHALRIGEWVCWVLVVDER
jgi:hypothetical protein